MSTNKSTPGNAKKPSFAIDLKLSLLSVFGKSDFISIYEAMVIHRNFCHAEMLSEIGKGCYHDAFLYQQDFENIQETLDGLITGLAQKSFDNYRAEEETRSPGNWDRMDAAGEVRQEEDYQRFLKRVSTEEN